MTRRIFSALALALFVQAALFAEEPAPRTIAVTGDADVKIAPDRAEISIGVESRDLDLKKAKADNDDRVRRLMAALKANRVDAKDIQTDYIAVEPRYRNFDTKELQFYLVRKNAVVTVRDLSRFESVLDAAISAGANQIQGVQFETSDLRKQKDRARELAVTAAREKASAMAATLDMKLGPAREVRENDIEPRPVFMRMAEAKMAGGADESTVSPGQIDVRASVAITFDLVPGR